MRVGSKVCDNRNVFEFEHADWNGLHKTLRQHDLAPCETTDIDTDWAKWKDLFLCAAAKHITQKLFKMCNTPPCIDGKVKHLLIKKHTHRRMAKRKVSTYWEKYRELRRNEKYIINEKRIGVLQVPPNLTVVKFEIQVLVSFQSAANVRTIPAK